MWRRWVSCYCWKVGEGVVDMGLVDRSISIFG